MTTENKETAAQGAALDVDSVLQEVSHSVAAASLNELAPVRRNRRYHTLIHTFVFEILLPHIVVILQKFNIKISAIYL